MKINIRLGLSAAVLALLAANTSAQAPSGPLEIRAVAEVESKARDRGRDIVKLIPADRVVPGDRVLYTLEVRNSGDAALDAPVVVHPVPEHMRYVAGTAVGPGAEVTYSVDGGHTFDRAENLTVPGADGNLRPAVAAVGGILVVLAILRATTR